MIEKIWGKRNMKRETKKRKMRGEKIGRERICWGI